MARKFFLHLYMMRIPLFILLLMGLVLPLAFGSPMLHGLADLERNQILMVSLGAFLLLSAAMTCAFLVLLYGSERADAKRLPMASSLASVTLPTRLPRAGWMVGVLYLVGSLLYLRFLYAVLQTMKEAHANPAGLSGIFWRQALPGAFIGILLIFLVFFVDLWISDPRQAPEIEVFALPILYIFREKSWIKGVLKKISDSRPSASLRIPQWLLPWRRVSLFLVRILGPGYGQFDASGNPVTLNPGHGFAGMLALVCIGLYLVAGSGEYNRLYTDAPFGPARPYDAVLLQIILLLLLACWLLSGVTFYFDRFRVVVLVPIVSFLFLTSHLGSSDHAFHTLPRGPSPSSAVPTAEAKFAAAPDHVIVVAAAGGGIQAAAWTSQVLCGLRQEIGPAFDDRVLVISGVSGGSVGAMFYLRCRESPDKNVDAAQAATLSSLEAIAWGLAHPDLRHAILPVAGLWWWGTDRGWALERALRKNAQFSPQERPLVSSSAVEQWPVLLFNSTEARTGDPMVFTNSNFPVKVPPGEENHHLHSFHRVYDGRDVLLETAVRMSAAFPYVSPAARADTPWKAEHLVDGAYFDNSGLFSLGEWLKEASSGTGSEGRRSDPRHPTKKILLVRIDAFPDSSWNGPNDHPKSWAYQLIAPITAILHVRSEGQLVRNTTGGADLIEVLTHRGYEASGITVRYVPSPGTGGTGSGLNCPADPPLTWHLTEVEKLCIQQNWAQIKEKLVAQVNDFLASPIKSTAPTELTGDVGNERLEKGLYLHRMARH